jgi:hypothetical protein
VLRLHVAFNIIRKDKAQQVVYGWASVSVANGELVTDLQGDQIEPDVLEQAVEDFMLNYRAQQAGGAGVMHETEPMCEVIASLVTTPDIVKAFGLGEVIPIGWILGLKVLDADTWRRVESGELKALSIQGTAERTAT